MQIREEINGIDDSALSGAKGEVASGGFLRRTGTHQVRRAADGVDSGMI
jgi:hypothetical protein